MSHMDMHAVRRLPSWTVAWSILVCAAGLALGCTSERPSPSSTEWDDRALPFAPRTYVIQRAPTVPQMDGRLAENAWQDATWTEPFVHNRGADHMAPSFRTRARMMWDDRFLYIGAKLEEPHVRADFVTRDTTIWRENALELFIDPDGDTHHYYEFQTNARGTIWDLLLTRPYRDGGEPISAWDIRGLQMGIDVHGTLNDPSDTDTGWTVELALPWSVLQEAAPDGAPPAPGDRWRLNLTRMQWPVTIVEGGYVRDTTDAEPLAWSPHGDRGFHTPERWGIVQFSDQTVGAAPDSVSLSPTDRVRWALRRLYDRQQQFYDANGRYAASLARLDASEITISGHAFEPTLQATPLLYELTAPGLDGSTIHLRQDGKTWTTE